MHFLRKMRIRYLKQENDQIKKLKILFWLPFFVHTSIHYEEKKKRARLLQDWINGRCKISRHVKNSDQNCPPTIGYFARFRFFFSLFFSFFRFGSSLSFSFPIFFFYPINWYVSESILYSCCLFVMHDVYFIHSPIYE